MADREAEVINAYESTLQASLDATSGTCLVASVGSLQFPTYLVIDPEEPNLREYVWVTGAVGNTLTLAERYGEGSAAPAGLVHPVGAVVRQAIVAQFLDDLHDRINAVVSDLDDHAGGFAVADHPEATVSSRGFMSSADKSKLDGIEAGATADQTQAEITALAWRPGMIVPYGGAAAPDAAWLLCDGAAVSRSTYSGLFAVIGSAYGAGDGSTTFNLPDLRGRFPIGVGTLGTDTYARGDSGGEARHVLTLAELAAHDHGATGSDAHTHAVGTLATAGGSAHTHGFGSLTLALAGDHVHNVDVRRGSTSAHTHGQTTQLAAGQGQDAVELDTQSVVTAGAHLHNLSGATASESAHTHTLSGATASDAHTHTTSSAGSGTAHENRPPYLAVNYLIKT